MFFQLQVVRISILELFYKLGDIIDDEKIIDKTENMTKLSSFEEKRLPKSKPRGMPIILRKNNFQR